MPELPEVETTRRGVAPHCLGQRIVGVAIRNTALRWPVPVDLEACLSGQTVTAVDRRGKYLLLRTGAGTVIIHLGMSGSLCLADAGAPPQCHDHLDIRFADDRCLRLRDPRRFGAVLWTDADPLLHERLRHLGREPLEPGFDGSYLFLRSRHRRVSIKDFLMDARVVVGLGNIYANEALFAAGIDPRRAAGRIARRRYQRLSGAVQEVLAEAITAGGTTLRDFVHGEGQPGYFRTRLRVYGRGGAACPDCQGPVRECRLSQRSTYYCARCQR